MSKDTSGPAFPIKEPLNCDALGVSVRDYFAAHASDSDVKDQGEILRCILMAQPNGIGILPDNWRVTARYMHADAMLKAREVV
jgi:hypothetical protein